MEIAEKDTEIEQLITDHDEHVQAVREEYRSLRDCLDHEQDRMLGELRQRKSELQDSLKQAKTELDKAHAEQPHIEDT